MTTPTFSLNLEDILERVLTSYIEVIEGLKASKNPAADAVTLKFFWLISKIEEDAPDSDVHWAIDRLKGNK